MQQQIEIITPVPDESVSPALEKRGIQNEGGFLTPYYLFDLLERRHGDELDLPGREANYVLLKRTFQQVQRSLIGLSSTQISIERTWSLWYKLLFQTLGFSQLKRLAEPFETARRDVVPISHAYYLDSASDEDAFILVDLHPFGTDLDRDHYPNSQRNPAITTEPISRALELVLDFNQARWALLSNGLEMRLYRRGGSVARQYLKVDFVTLFERVNDKDWLVFWGLFRLAAFLTSSGTGVAEGSDSSSHSRCLLEKVIEESQRHATRIADDLRLNIVEAVESLLQGVIDAPTNRHLWEGMLDAKKVPSETQLKSLFEECIYFLYRLLFVLYAESRDLLPVSESLIYRATYSLEHLRSLAEKSLRPEDYDKIYYVDTEHDFAYVLNSFPLLDRDQPPLPGEERSFVTRDLALLALFLLRSKTPPVDIIAFFNEAGVDIRYRTGPIIDLNERVRIATKVLGAVAYQPSRHERDDNAESDEIVDRDELDFDDEE